MSGIHLFFHVAVFHDRAGNHRREVAAKQQQLSIVALYRSDFIIDIEQISQKGQRVERNSHGRQQPQMEEFQRAQQTDTKKDSTNKSSQFFLLLFCPVYQNSCAPDSSYSCHRVQNQIPRMAVTHLCRCQKVSDAQKQQKRPLHFFRNQIIQQQCKCKQTQEVKGSNTHPSPAPGFRPSAE